MMFAHGFVTVKILLQFLFHPNVFCWKENYLFKESVHLQFSKTFLTEQHICVILLQKGYDCKGNLRFFFFKWHFTRW